jgi:hypothetical protein
MTQGRERAYRWEPCEDALLFEQFIYHDLNWADYQIPNRTPVMCQNRYYRIPYNRALSALEQEVVVKALCHFGPSERARIAACVHLDVNLIDQYTLCCFHLVNKELRGRRYVAV